MPRWHIIAGDDPAQSLKNIDPRQCQKAVLAEKRGYVFLVGMNRETANMTDHQIVDAGFRRQVFQDGIQPFGLQTAGMSCGELTKPESAGSGACRTQEGSEFLKSDLRDTFHFRDSCGGCADFLVCCIDNFFGQCAVEVRTPVGDDGIRRVFQRFGGFCGDTDD